jgi:hypothetical protein
MKHSHPLSKRSIGCTLALAASFFIQPAFAACSQSDLAGTWFVNGFSQDPFSGENENLYCKLKFGSGGAVLAGSSSCTARVKASKEAVNVIGGRLTLNTYCDAKGTIKFAGGYTLTVDSARFDKETSVFHLVGVGEAPDRWHVVLNGSKK